MTRVSWDDKSFMRWQEFHETTRVSWYWIRDSIASNTGDMVRIQGFDCIKHRRHGTDSGIQLHQTQATWNWFRDSIPSNTGDMVLIQRFDCIKHRRRGTDSEIWLHQKWGIQRFRIIFWRIFDGFEKWYWQIEGHRDPDLIRGVPGDQIRNLRSWGLGFLI